MRLFRIRNGNKYFEFAINKYKSLKGNLIDIYNLTNVIKNYFSKLALSEYTKEINQYNILIDSELVDLKSYQLICIDYTFDLINEYKLTQKSLLYKALEKSFIKKDYSEEFQTINILLRDVLNSIEDEFEDNGISINLDNFEINSKSILNNLSISLIKEELLSNQCDYSIEELAIIKLRIIKYLAINNKHITYIILDELGIINLNEISDYNNIIVLTTQKSTSIENIFDVNKNIDYSDDNLLYDLYLNENSGIKYDEYKQLLISRINSKQ